MADEIICDVREIMETIAGLIKPAKPVKLEDSFYSTQRKLISEIFESSKDYNKDTIILRLSAIDYFYSTNAYRTYYAIEDMAKKISLLGSEKASVDYFRGIVQNGKDSKGLFIEKYGIRKNLKEGGIQPSLMSKYAYYLLLKYGEDDNVGFPIYDKLAREIFPLLLKHLGEEVDSQTTDSLTIQRYVEELNRLRKKLFKDDERPCEMQQFDLLDAYLWRMGKIRNGNFSLLLTKDDYGKFIKKLGLKEQKDITESVVNILFKKQQSLNTCVFFNNCSAEIKKCMPKLYQHCLKMYPL